MVCGGRRFLLAFTIHAAIGQSRSKPPEVAGNDNSFLAIIWSSGNRDADFQYKTLELFNHSGSDRYTSSSEILLAFVGGWGRLEMDFRLRSFPLTLSLLFLSELIPETSLTVFIGLSSSPSCSFLSSLVVWPLSASTEEAEATGLPNVDSAMVRAWHLDGGVKKPVWSSTLVSENGCKKWWSQDERRKSYNDKW